MANGFDHFDNASSYIHPKASRALITAGWRDVPHLDEATQRELLAETPPWLREARSLGKPSLGAGAIFPIEESRVKYQPFPIPPHWPRAFAMDVGWNWTAGLWGAWDLDTSTLYVWGEYKVGEALPQVHAEAFKGRGAWIPGVIDPAANGRQQKDGEQLKATYTGLGLDLVNAENSVEAGLHQCWMGLSVGRIRVCSTLSAFFNEYRLYRRDEHGKIVKKNDHLMDCFDAETEVLTGTGWKRFSDINFFDTLATVNLETDALEYQLPEEIIAREHDGDMVRIGGRKMDALVTPNHRMVVYPRGKDKQEIRLAKDLSIWDRIKLHAKWKGEDRSAVQVKTHHGRSAEIDPRVWAELLGWWIAEGWKAKSVQMPGRGYQVGISQTKPEGRTAIEALLERTPWNWRYVESVNSYVTSCKWLWEYLSPLGDTYSKVAPQWVKDSSPDIIEAFIRGAVAGDGWVQNGARSYCTVSKALADDMQELFIKSGISASLRLGRPASDSARTPTGQSKTVDQYWLTEWKTPHGYLRDSANNPNFSTERYSGMVYCATVPNGTLIVRRNGKPMIAGNCLRYLVMSGRGVAKVKPPVLSDFIQPGRIGNVNPGGY